MKILLPFINCLLLLFSGHRAQAQSKPAETMLKEFYTNYMMTVAKGSAGPELQKLELLQKQHCTKACIKKIQAIDELDSDPFLKAQDSDSTWVKTLVVKKDLQNKNKYSVSYSYDLLVSVKPDKWVKEIVIIYVLVVKEKEGFKIDAVW